VFSRIKKRNKIKNLLESLALRRIVVASAARGFAWMRAWFAAFAHFFSPLLGLAL
jgi:hypothetical protein